MSLSVARCRCLSLRVAVCRCVPAARLGCMPAACWLRALLRASCVGSCGKAIGRGEWELWWQRTVPPRSADAPFARAGARRQQRRQPQEQRRKKVDRSVDCWGEQYRRLVVHEQKIYQSRVMNKPLLRNRWLPIIETLRL